MVESVSLRHQGIVEPLHPKAGEFGEPQWQFGMSTYGFDGTGNLWCLVNEQNIIRMVQLDSITGELMAVNLPYTVLSGIQVQGGRVAFIRGARGHAHRYRPLRHPNPPPGSVAPRQPQSGGPWLPFHCPKLSNSPPQMARLLMVSIMPPTNKDCTGPAGEKPPLLVFSHGGPTGASSAAYSLGIQFWTSRGFAVLDVNYRGSTGYGRAYRQALNGRWGIVDVDDCVAGALFLGQRGDVDEQRLAIRGGSAGGYTTLSALTFRQVFRAGASHFGVADLEALARETHKFESRYMDRLVGPYPERADLYRERSPIHAADKLSCPLIMFQGLDDAVVPPSQAEMMLAAARQKGLPVAYVPFAGEQHGFRQAKNIKRALDAELYFYGRIFKFVLADPVEPVEIENLAP